MTKNIETVKACGKGMAIGGLVGGTLSVISGAAIVCTAPAWLPVVGGAAVVSSGTVAAWGLAGSATCGTLSAGRSLFKHRKANRELREILESSK